MELTFAPRGILQINNARIVYRNFTGAASMYNHEGNRNFSLVIPDEETANALVAEGWNVKMKPPREEGDTPFYHLPVKVKFNDRGPAIHLISGNNRPISLDEDSVGCLDNIDIISVDLDIRPFDWEVQGKTGRTAYLQALEVTQDVDRFTARYAERGYDM